MKPRRRGFWFGMLRKAGRGAATHEACHEPMGDLALALDSGVGPDPARPRDRPRVDGGKRRRRGIAASERAGIGLAKSCDDRARCDAGARFFGRAGQGMSHSRRCAFRLALRENRRSVVGSQPDRNVARQWTFPSLSRRVEIRDRQDEAAHDRQSSSVISKSSWMTSDRRWI